MNVKNYTMCLSISWPASKDICRLIFISAMSFIKIKDLILADIIKAIQFKSTKILSFRLGTKVCII